MKYLFLLSVIVAGSVDGVGVVVVGDGADGALQEAPEDPHEDAQAGVLLDELNVLVDVFLRGLGSIYGLARDWQSIQYASR